MVTSAGVLRVPKGVSVGSTGLLDDYSTLAREYNNPVKVSPKDVETPSTTKSKPEETTVKKLRDATASEKADLMALSLPHLRTAIKNHHPQFPSNQLKFINKSNKEEFIDDIFGFPQSRPVAGEAKKRFSYIDSDDDDDAIPPARQFRTPFQPHRPPSAVTKTFRGGEGTSTGSGFGDPARSREEDDQDEYFATLPKDVQNALIGADEQDDFVVYSPRPLPVSVDTSAPPKTKLLKQKLALRKEAKEAKEAEVAPNVTVRPQQFDIPISSNRRDTFEDDRPISGTSLFFDDKATSIPVRPKLSVGFADMLDEKRKEKEIGRARVESDNSARIVASQNDLLDSVTKSSSKATPPRHSDSNQKTPNQDGRPMKPSHNLPREMPFDLSVVSASAPFSPARKPIRKGSSIPQPVATIEASKKGRPIGSKNKVPNSQSIVGNELNSQSIVGNVFG